jgi:hypothetical protein
MLCDAPPARKFAFPACEADKTQFPTDEKETKPLVTEQIAGVLLLNKIGAKPTDEIADGA